MFIIQPSDMLHLVTCFPINSQKLLSMAWKSVSKVRNRKMIPLQQENICTTSVISKEHKTFQLLQSIKLGLSLILQTVTLHLSVLQGMHHDGTSQKNYLLLFL